MYMECVDSALAFVHFSLLFASLVVDLSSQFCFFRRFFGDVQREFLQRFSAKVHRTLGSFIRDALPEGSADAAACLSVPGAWVCGAFSSLLLLA
jgi:hypothetical protein